MRPNKRRMVNEIKRQRDFSVSVPFFFKCFNFQCCFFKLWMFKVRGKLEQDYTETTERISSDFTWRMCLGPDFGRYYTSWVFIFVVIVGTYNNHYTQTWCPVLITLLIHSFLLTSLTVLSQIEDTCFSLTFFGEGYSESTDPSQGRPNAKICTQVVGAGKSACIYTSVYRWAYLQQQHV